MNSHDLRQYGHDSIDKRHVQGLLERGKRSARGRHLAIVDEFDAEGYGTMLQQYFISQNNRESGPFDARKIVEFWQNGTIRETTLIRDTAHGQWKNIREIPAFSRLVSTGINQPNVTTVLLPPPLSNSIPSKRLWGTLWYAVPITATLILGIIAILWYQTNWEANEILKANQAVAAINERLNDWLDSKTKLSPKEIEDLIDQGQSHPKATNTKHLEDTIAKARHKQLVMAADKLLSDAKSSLAAGDMNAAESILLKYLVNPHGTDHSSAQRLLSELSFAGGQKKAEDELRKEVEQLRAKEASQRKTEEDLREEVEQLRAKVDGLNKVAEELRKEEIRLAEIKANEQKARGPKVSEPAEKTSAQKERSPIKNSQQDPLDMTDEFKAVVNISEKYIGKHIKVKGFMTFKEIEPLQNRSSRELPPLWSIQFVDKHDTHKVTSWSSYAYLGDDAYDKFHIYCKSEIALKISQYASKLQGDVATILYFTITAKNMAIIYRIDIYEPASNKGDASDVLKLKMSILEDGKVVMP